MCFYILKIKYVITSAALVSILLSGCSVNHQNTNVGKVTNENTINKNNQSQEPKTATLNKEFEGVSFNYPNYMKELKISNGTEKYVVYLVDADKTTFNLVVEDIPKDMKLDEYIKISFGNTGNKAISNKNYKDNNLDWNEVISNSNGLQLNQRTIINNGKAYVFTYGCLPENYDKHIKVFTDITSSVKILTSTDNGKTQNNSASNDDTTDPVAKQMSDPNTELGKAYSNILQTQDKIDKASEERAKKEADNAKIMSEEKKGIIMKIDELQKEKLKYPNDNYKQTTIQGDINILQTRLDTTYKNVK